MTWDSFLTIAIVALASVAVVYRFTKKSTSKCGGNCGCCQSQGSPPHPKDSGQPLPMAEKECGQCAAKE